MNRLLTQLLHFGRSAWLGLRASSVTSAIAAATIAVTLLLVGAFGLLVTNMQALLQRFGEEMVLSAYLEEDVDAEQHQRLAAQVRGLPGVAEVALVTKEEALERFREGVGGRTALLEGLEENPLPASLEVTLADAQRTPESLATLTEAIAGLPGVDELGSGQEWIEGYSRAVALVRVLGVVIGGVLALAALLIVANTIRLAIYARRDELEILMLVGASRTFVSVPFLLEGLVQGVLGGAFALVLLYTVYRLLLPSLEQGLSFLLGYAEPSFLGWEGGLLIVGTGAALGVLGSAAALLQGWRT